MFLKYINQVNLYIKNKKTESNLINSVLIRKFEYLDYE